MNARIIYIIAIILTLSACSKNRGTDKPVLAVSVEPQRWLLEQIAGDGFSVVTAMTPGSNPETFEPSIAIRAEIEKADAYFTSGGLTFEQTLRSSVTHPRIFDTSSGIEYIYGTHGADDSSHVHEGGSSGYDPHVWASVRNARIMARNMYNSLCELHPAQADSFGMRYRALDARLDSLDRALDSQLAALAGKAFLVWHPSLSYFARDYGLHQLSVGWESKEASPATIRTVIDHARADSVEVFFFQREYDSRQAESLNAQLGARMVTIDPMSYHWQEQLKLVADEISR